MVCNKPEEEWMKKNGVKRKYFWKAKPALNFPTRTEISIEIKLQSTV